MNALLPIAITFCVLCLSSLLTRLVERITGRSDRISNTRYRVASVVSAVGCIVLTTVVFASWSFLWQIAFLSTSLCVLLLVAQGVWGAPSGPNQSSKRTREKPRAA
jgi:hypothetical protein